MVDANDYHFGVTVVVTHGLTVISEVRIGNGAPRSYEFDPELFYIQIFGSRSDQPITSIKTYDPLAMRVYQGALLPSIDVDFQNLNIASSPGERFILFDRDQGSANDVVRLPVTDLPAPFRLSTPGLGGTEGRDFPIQPNGFISLDEVFSQDRRPVENQRERAVRLDSNTVTYFLPFDGRAENVVASFADGSSVSKGYQIGDIVASFCQEHGEVVDSCSR